MDAREVFVGWFTLSLSTVTLYFWGEPITPFPEPIQPLNLIFHAFYLVILATFAIGWICFSISLWEAIND